MNNMMPQWIIEKKRDKKPLSEEEIRWFIEGYSNGDIPDYQMAAMAMAIYLNGMTLEETVVLTDAMMRSGDLVDTSSLSAPTVDKHSTGGIGDKVSLVLAPLVACCGVAVPMISGRGLGITGGTLDKLEAIPGYRTDLSEEEFIRVLSQCGCSIIGQTGQIAPADKKLYALRDVTATVPSIPLIVASIMSKKLAEGIDSLVLDVKWGRGAFMQSYEQATDLARNLVEVGHRMGKGIAAILTDMNQPLGRTAGNALEVMETIDCLKGEGPDDMMEVTLKLGARMLTLTGVQASEAEALEAMQAQLKSGAALDCFKTMVELQGGDPASIDDPMRLPTASTRHAVQADRAGVVTAVDANLIGRACLLLGAGRSKTDDEIDPAVGISELAKIGEEVQAGTLLAEVHANEADRLDQALAMLDDAFCIDEELRDEPPALIRDVIQPTE